MRILFTDLDGTFLDHDTYDPGPAWTALEEVRAGGIEVVMASAKTAAELDVLRRRFGLPRRFVAENGAVLAWDDETIVYGLPFEVVRAGLEIAAHRAGVRVRGYADMPVEEIAGRTGLPVEGARLAARRQHSETFLVERGDRQELEDRVSATGLTIVQGSRFLTVQGPHDKGTPIPDVLARAGPATTFAVGDAGNDEGMLGLVDRPMLVRSRDGSHVEMDVPGLIRLDGVGPDGWVEAARRVLAAG